MASLKFFDGEVNDWKIEYEDAEFKKDWEDNWNPLNCEHPIGIMKVSFRTGIYRWSIILADYELYIIGHSLLQEPRRYVQTTPILPLDPQRTQYSDDNRRFS